MCDQNVELLALVFLIFFRNFVPANPSPSPAAQHMAGQVSMPQQYQPQQFQQQQHTGYYQQQAGYSQQQPQMGKETANVFLRMIPFSADLLLFSYQC